MARALGLAESGDPRRLQRQHARRWIEGERTPNHWWPYIAQVLGLDPETINLPEAMPAALRTDTVASVLHLGRSDVDRRNFIVASSGYALSALDLPDMDSITRRTKSASPGSLRVSSSSLQPRARMAGHRRGDHLEDASDRRGPAVPSRRT